MFDYGYDHQPPFAAALMRLAKLRRQELLLRAVIWVWAAATLAWMLPLGSLSAEHQPPATAALAGIVLALVGAALVVRYRALSRITVIEPTQIPIVEIHGGMTGRAAFFSRAAHGGAETPSAPPRPQ